MKQNHRTAEKLSPNNVQKIREERLMSKAELAKQAGLSVLTVDRVEQGKECRMATKRKIIKALGIKLTEKEKVFRRN
jgi:DNA-binding XRE family transcriptional regulator